MNEGKSFQIPKHQVMQDYKYVKANPGAIGIDGIGLEEHEKDFENNLYKPWNRMLSGSYFPKSVKGVGISRKKRKRC